MRKIFKKAMAGMMSVALVATLLIGVDMSKSVKAEDTPVELGKWTFTQGGQFNDTELWNAGYITSVSMHGTDEVISGWLKGDDNIPAAQDPSFNQKQTANDVSDGFDLEIEANSQDKDWTNDRINPWAIEAEMQDISVEAGHKYTVSFKAHASTRKYCYVSFGCDIEGTAPYGEAPLDGNPLIAFTTEDQTFTYQFTNFVSATKMSVELLLGAFNSQNDFAGNNVSDIITSVESMWGGSVYVSEFTIVDNGLDPEFVDPNAPETESTAEETTLADASGDAEVTTVAPTTPEVPTIPSTSEVTTAAPAPVTTVAPNNNPGGNVTPATTANNNSVTTPNNNTPATPAQSAKKLGKVKKVKAKNNKKGRVTVTWKKVAHAKKYQVKVGKKSYTSKKTKYVVKKGLKKGKTYKIKVRAKAANGYKAGAWSKAVKVKIKK